MVLPPESVEISTVNITDALPLLPCLVQETVALRLVQPEAPFVVNVPDVGVIRIQYWEPIPVVVGVPQLVATVDPVSESVALKDIVPSLRKLMVDTAGSPGGESDQTSIAPFASATRKF